MRHGRRGLALVNVLMFTVVTTIFLVVGVQFVSSSYKVGRAERTNTQVYNVALAGINHAIAWLKKQTPQPVTRFDPLAVADPDEESETPIAEEQIGLVHEFAVDATRNLYGRYEVGRSTASGNQAPARNGLTAGASDPMYDKVNWTAEDISKQRGKAAGSVWVIRSRGYVWTKKGGETFRTATTKKIRLTLEAEVLRTSIGTRAAAIYSFAGGDPNDAIKLESATAGWLKVDVVDGTANSYWCNAIATKTNIAAGVDFGTPAAPNKPGENDPTKATFVDTSLGAQLQHVFGTSDLAVVRTLADKYYAKQSDIDEPFPAGKFVYIKGDVDFDGSAAKNLDGSGVLFIEGNLTIDGGTVPQNYNGLIFTTGSYKQKNNSNILGAVIAGGVVHVKGDDATANKAATLRYSANTLEQVATNLGEYRLEHSTLRILDDSLAPEGH